VANLARQDAHDFLKIADDLHIRSQATVFSLEQPNGAPQAVKQNTGHGWAGLFPEAQQRNRLSELTQRL